MAFPTRNFADDANGCDITAPCAEPGEPAGCHSAGDEARSVASYSSCVWTTGNTNISAR